MPAGLEEPPRINPPNPQHPEIPQTYDPRVSVQLDRAARDAASGHPGAAALEDAERFEGRLNPAPTTVETSITRETPVTFSEQFASYFAGEVAAFTEDEAARLAALGVTGEGGAASAPVNVDVPHVQQAADVLTCTMGNWQGEPTAYAYAWTLDGAPVGTDSATHTVTSAEVGQTAVCTVTATNAAGSTAAPPSVGVVVTDPAGATRTADRRHRS